MARASERVLVVLPTRNEAGNIGTVLAGVRTSAPEADVLVVDDDSWDGTAEEAEAVGARLGRIEVLRHGPPQGLGVACRDAFDLALTRGYDVVVTMDADGSHQPRELPRLLELSTSHDLVIGSRYVEGGGISDWHLGRRVLSRAANLYAGAMLRIPVRDLTTGYRAYRTAGLAAMGTHELEAVGYAFEVELVRRAHRARLRIAEHPITFAERRVGQSKMSAWMAREAFARISRWAARDALMRFAPALARRLTATSREPARGAHGSTVP